MTDRPRLSDPENPENYRDVVEEARGRLLDVDVDAVFQVTARSDADGRVWTGSVVGARNDLEGEEREDVVDDVVDQVLASILLETDLTAPALAERLAEIEAATEAGVER